MLRRWIILLLLSLTAACNAVPGQSQATLIPAETLEPLDKTVNFWDMGLAIKYPRNWAEPQFASGQLLITKSIQDVNKQPLVQPVVTLSLVNFNSIKIPPNSSLQAILNRVTQGADVVVRESEDSKIAGLDSYYMALLDKKLEVNGYTTAFRMPDGRVGTLIAIAPSTIWAYVLPSFDEMRVSARLLKPNEYPAPAAPTEPATFAAGGMTFAVPKGWVKSAYQGAELFYDKQSPLYADNSGFANGPLLTLVARPVAKTDDLLTSLDSMIGAKQGDTIKDITVSGQPAYQMESSDSVTGQVIMFVGVKTLDGNGVILLRWTAPGILRDVLRPTFDAIVQSIRLSSSASK